MNRTEQRGMNLTRLFLHISPEFHDFARLCCRCRFPSGGRIKIFTIDKNLGSGIGFVPIGMKIDSCYNLIEHEIRK